MTDGANLPYKTSCAPAPLPVLWIHGPGGVGKTTVGWQLFTRMSRDGTPTGFVDIDQIGMCYAAPTAQDPAPEPASDRGRHRLKSRSLGAVAARFRAAGARGLIVSGITDPARGIDAALLPNAVVTPCRLRVEREEHLRRLATRGRPGEPIGEILGDAEELDRSGLPGAGHRLPGAVIDTTGLDVTQVVRQMEIEVAEWKSGVEVSGGGCAAHRLRLSAADELVGAYGGPVADAPGEILWICGPTAVGKSTVAWSAYLKSRFAGQRTAFLDLDQVGFHRPAPADDPGNHRLKAGNLAGVWRNYAASGARRLVTLGPLDRPEAAEIYRAALPGARLTICRLGVSRARLDERIAHRGRGEAPGSGIAGDELKGRSSAALSAVAERAWAEAVALERSGVADISVETDGRDGPQIAADILELAGWAE